MSPKPYTPGDEIEYINGSGIRKKLGKGGNSQKRSEFFFHQRFPFLAEQGEEPPKTDKETESRKKKRSLKKVAHTESQEQPTAPLARVRAEMMREYTRRLLAQQQELEQAATDKARAADQEK